MNFELLPNEILLDLFSCLNGFDLLHAFYNLNSRFNLLPYNEFRSYRFNFFSFSKRKFDMICQQHLPFIAGQVITLTLSDCDDTPDQINLFLSHIPSLSQFTHLRYLELLGLRSYQTLIKIVDKFDCLCHLNRLKLYFRNDQADMQIVINNIWNLPKLTHLHFDVRIDNEQNFSLPTKVSTSLQNICVYRQTFQWNALHELFKYTPRLKCVHICIHPFSDNDYKPSPMLTLINLNINSFSISDSSKIISFLQNIPNLRRLKIFSSCYIINGYQWEQLIRKYLLKLKVFELNMTEERTNNQNVEERADELINSFRSSFWINEHQWFVRYFIYGKSVYIKNLSDSFYRCSIKPPDSWKSTCPNDNHLEFYKNMITLSNERFFEQPLPSDICLPNIGYLCLKLPVPDRFWSIVPSLNTLYSLQVSSHNDTYQSQLQDLLDRAPKLSRLYISPDASLPLQMSLFKYTNPSVRQLNLRNYNHRFNKEECLTLIQSPFGVQCEVLSILVKTRECIIVLVKHMVNLRALHVECEDDKLTENFYEFHRAKISNKDEVVQWLKHHLPSTCLTARDPYSISCIRIWI